MTDAFENINDDEFHRVSSSNTMIEQSELVDSHSVSSSSDVLYNELDISSGNMQLLFIIIATVTTLICLTLCISVCIYICYSRRRKSKRPRKIEYPLIPAKSENRLALKNSLSRNINSSFYSHNKQSSEKKPSPSSTNIISGKIPYFYENLDDIPFIDESRPTSFIDITRV